MLQMLLWFMSTRCYYYANFDFHRDFGNRKLKNFKFLVAHFSQFNAFSWWGFSRLCWWWSRRVKIEFHSRKKTTTTKKVQFFTHKKISSSFLHRTLKFLLAKDGKQRDKNFVNFQHSLEKLISSEEKVESTTKERVTEEPSRLIP